MRSRRIVYILLWILISINITALLLGLYDKSSIYEALFEIYL